MKYIESIKGFIPNTEKEIKIHLGGRSLIITGPNGSGKTSFIKAIYNKTNFLIRDKVLADFESLKTQAKNVEKILSDSEKGSTMHNNYNSLGKTLEEKLNHVEEGIILEIPKYIDFSIGLDRKTTIISFFEATRAAKISHADTAHGLTSDREKYSKKNDENNNFGANLEQHLVNLKNRRSLAISEDNDKALAEKIDYWILHFEENLKELMEDRSTKLVFDSERLKFKIKQNGKPAFSFQNLSAGYLAIFDIYADLLMRVEYFGVKAEELEGVVFIDEIDAHLHVSLQRQFLPFLERSFPKLQYIVTTHSPFVLMSVNDMAIYDLGQNNQLDVDLSFHSYSSVMEGILKTKPTSKLLDNVISEIASIVNSENRNYELLEGLIDKIRPIEKNLTLEYKSFFLLGENALLNKEQD